MNDYQCQVVQANGSRAVIHRRAPSEEVLVRDLNAEGYLITRINVADPSGRRKRARLKPKSILQFTEILETLTSNGLALKEALVLARNLGGPQLAGLFSSLDAQVQKGISFHHALEQGPRGFSPLYLGLVRIGEQTGDLTVIFPRLVEYLKARGALREKAISSLIYPSFVLAVALVGVILLSTLVLPSLTGSISSVNPQVALQYRQNVGSFQTASGLLLGGLGALVGAGMALWIVTIRSGEWRLRVDRWVLRLPLVGSLAWKSFCLHISFSLEILLASGFPLESALAECAPLIRNRALRQSWEQVRLGVVKGERLSRSLRHEGGYPEVFVGWIEVGESAHDLRRSFQHLRMFYQNQIDLLSARFANLAEPALIVVVGVMVLLLVMTFVTPIFAMLGGIL